MAGEKRRERKNVVASTFVTTTRVQTAFTRIDKILEEGWADDFCLALLMFGPSGSGKTRIAKEWIKSRTASAEKEGSSLNVVYVEVPQGCNLPSMAAQLLMALGCPRPDYGSQTERTRRVGELAELNQVDLIVIDEIQRLIQFDTFKVKKDVASWLTTILNQRISPLLLMGEPHAELIFQGDDVGQKNIYLERRTMGEVPITPYDWNVPQECLEFRTILNILDTESGMAERSDLAVPDTALRIHAFTHGRIGLVSRLLKEAVAVANSAGLSKLTKDVLADAVDALRIGSDKAAPNPFRMETVLPGGPAAIHVRDKDFELPRRGRPARLGLI